MWKIILTQQFSNFLHWETQGNDNQHIELEPMCIPRFKYSPKKHHEEVKQHKIHRQVIRVQAGLRAGFNLAHLTHSRNHTEDKRVRNMTEVALFYSNLPK